MAYPLKSLRSDSKNLLEIPSLRDIMLSLPGGMLCLITSMPYGIFYHSSVSQRCSPRHLVEGSDHYIVWHSPFCLCVLSPTQDPNPSVSHWTGSEATDSPHPAACYYYFYHPFIEFNTYNILILIINHPEHNLWRK